jgi:uncharacterized protein YqeY
MQMTEEQIKNGLIEIIDENYENPLKLGELLKILKLRYDGQYDGGIAAKLAKKLLLI